MNRGVPWPDHTILTAKLGTAAETSRHLCTHPFPVVRMNQFLHALAPARKFADSHPKELVRDLVPNERIGNNLPSPSAHARGLQGELRAFCQLFLTCGRFMGVG